MLRKESIIYECLSADCLTQFFGSLRESAPALPFIRINKFFEFLVGELDVV